MKSNWPNEPLRNLAREAVEKYGKALSGIIPKDAKEWGWDGSDYVTFYSELLGILAKYESGFDTNETYTEAFKDANGKRVISRGLLQISIESGRFYDKQLKSAEELHSPAVNLRVGVRIMSFYIEREGVISGGSKGKWKSAARYWSQFRKPARLEEMRRAVKQVLTQGEPMQRTVTEIPKFGDHGTGNVRPLQEALGVTADDWFGNDTLKALQKFQKKSGLTGTGIIPADGGQTLKLLGIKFSPPQEGEINDKPIHSDNYFGAPHMGIRVDLLGRSESDSALSAWLVPEWGKEGLDYKDLVGASHAWCSVTVNKKLRDAGIEGTNSAAASSHSKWGKKSPFWFGCTLPIRHKYGGRHVCLFLYWINKEKKICATMDGNRSNKYAIFETDLSGKGDTLVGGPRWSKELPDGQSPTMEEVLAKYPFLKVGGKGVSTR